MNRMPNEQTEKKTTAPLASKKKRPLIPIDPEEVREWRMERFIRESVARIIVWQRFYGENLEKCSNADIPPNFESLKNRLTTAQHYFDSHPGKYSQEDQSKIQIYNFWLENASKQHADKDPNSYMRSGSTDSAYSTQLSSSSDYSSSSNNSW